MPEDPEQNRPDQGKKILVDEDYKTQVQAEKERESAGPTHQAAPRSTPPLPPASFPILVAMLGTQAWIALGIVPNPISGKPDPDPEQARHFIDLLGVLQEKTKGNLSSGESKHLEALLFDLRMQYVQSRSGNKSQAPQGEEPA